MRTRTLAAAFGLTLLAFGSPASAEPEVEISSLKGIQFLSVSISEIAPEFEQKGFSSSGLRTSIVQQLHRRGVIVIGSTRGMPGSPRLYAVVRLADAEGGVSYSVSLRLYQDASLVSSSRELDASVMTWEASAVGFASNGAKDVGTMLRSLADNFVLDWAAANGMRVRKKEPGGN